MKFYIAYYRTYDGEHEYAEFSVFASRTYKAAVKRMEKGKRFFASYGWAEYCRLDRLQQIPKQDYLVLKKYFNRIGIFIFVPDFLSTYYRRSSPDADIGTAD